VLWHGAPAAPARAIGCLAWGLADLGRAAISLYSPSLVLRDITGAIRDVCGTLRTVRVVTVKYAILQHKRSSRDKRDVSGRFCPAMFYLYRSAIGTTLPFTSSQKKRGKKRP
jgi:hypothetical protein